MPTSFTKRYSVDEFLAFEEKSDVRHEYFDGEIFDMAGGTATHSLAKVNTTTALSNALKQGGCRVYDSDLMIKCPTGLRTYPDASVVCEEPNFEGESEIVLLNPLVIIEVLSESTEAYDRGRKFDHYRTIPSLREYVLVAQDRAHVDHYQFQDYGIWTLRDYDSVQSAVKFPILECEIPLAEIYANVTFEQKSEEEESTEKREH